MWSCLLHVNTATNIRIHLCYTQAVSGELGRVPEQLYVRLLAAMSSPLHPASRASAELMDGPEGAPGPLSLLAVKSMPQGSAPLSVQQEEDVQRIIQGVVNEGE